MVTRLRSACKNHRKNSAYFFSFFFLSLSCILKKKKENPRPRSYINSLCRENRRVCYYPTHRWWWWWWWGTYKRKVTVRYITKRRAMMMTGLTRCAHTDGGADRVTQWPAKGIIISCWPPCLYTCLSCLSYSFSASHLDGFSPVRGYRRHVAPPLYSIHLYSPHLLFLKRKWIH